MTPSPPSDADIISGRSITCTAAALPSCCLTPTSQTPPRSKQFRRHRRKCHFLGDTTRNIVLYGTPQFGDYSCTEKYKSEISFVPKLSQNVGFPIFSVCKTRVENSKLFANAPNTLNRKSSLSLIFSRFSTTLLNSHKLLGVP